MVSMSLSLDKVFTPEQKELHRKKTILADRAAQLAERDLDFASLWADLVHSEGS
jgi:hypothetical protein